MRIILLFITSDSHLFISFSTHGHSRTIYPVAPTPGDVPVATPLIQPSLESANGAAYCKSVEEVLMYR